MNRFELCLLDLDLYAICYWISAQTHGVCVIGAKVIHTLFMSFHIEVLIFTKIVIF